MKITFYKLPIFPSPHNHHKACTSKKSHLDCSDSGNSSPSYFNMQLSSLSRSTVDSKYSNKVDNSTIAVPNSIQTFTTDTQFCTEGFFFYFVIFL